MADTQRSRERRVSRCALLFAILLQGLQPVDAHAQDGSDTPAGIVLKVSLAQDLASQALEDAVEPLGALLGKIGSSAGYSRRTHGFGYVSFAAGVTGLAFDITNPDYSNIDRLERAERIRGPLGAVYGDLELGVFRGYRSGEEIDGLFSVDFLARFGVSLGDQRNLAEQVEFDSVDPMYGFGVRLGIMRGPTVPDISMSAGYTTLSERTFRVVSQDQGISPGYEIALQLKETNSFLLGEIGHVLGMFIPYGGIGITWQTLKSNYVSEVSHEGGPSVIKDDLSFGNTSLMAFAGFEVGGESFRLAFEGGQSAAHVYGSMSIRLSAKLK